MAGTSPEPPRAYRGEEAFVFVCYAHTDHDAVMAELARLNETGYHLWYDEGIAPGSEWNAEIASAIQRCSAFLYFISPSSVESEHCRRELNFALDESCEVLSVHLEDTDMPPAVRLTLSHRQAILKYADAHYEARLSDALDKCLTEPPGSSERAAPAAVPKPRTQKRSLGTALGLAAVISIAALFSYAPWDSTDPAQTPAADQEIENRPRLAMFEPAQNTGTALVRTAHNHLAAKLGGRDDVGLVAPTTVRQIQSSPYAYSQLLNDFAITHVLEWQLVDPNTIAAAVIATGSEELLWSQSFDLSGDGATRATQISGELLSSITRVLQLATRTELPVDPAAYALAAEELWLRENQVALNVMGYTQRNIQLLMQALTIQPEYWEAHVRLGVIFCQIEPPHMDLDRCRYHAEQAVRLNPNNPRSHLALGMALERVGDLAGALEALEASKALNPTTGSFPYAYVMARAGMTARWRSEIQLIDELDPFNCYDDMVVYRIAIGETARARELGREKMGYCPENWTFYLDHVPLFEMAENNFVGAVRGALDEFWSVTTRRFEPVSLPLTQQQYDQVANQLAGKLGQYSISLNGAAHIARVLFELGDSSGAQRWLQFIEATYGPDFFFRLGILRNEAIRRLDERMLARVLTEYETEFPMDLSQGGFLAFIEGLNAHVRGESAPAAEYMARVLEAYPMRAHGMDLYYAPYTLVAAAVLEDGAETARRIRWVRDYFNAGRDVWASYPGPNPERFAGPRAKYFMLALADLLDGQHESALAMFGRAYESGLRDLRWLHAFGLIEDQYGIYGTFTASEEWRDLVARIRAHNESDLEAIAELMAPGLDLTVAAAP